MRAVHGRRTRIAAGAGSLAQVVNAAIAGKDRFDTMTEFLAGVGAGLWPDVDTACTELIRVTGSTAPDAATVAALQSVVDRIGAEAIVAVSDAHLPLLGDGRGAPRLHGTGRQLGPLEDAAAVLLRHPQLAADDREAESDVSPHRVEDDPAVAVVRRLFRHEGRVHLLQELGGRLGEFVAPPALGREVLGVVVDPPREGPAQVGGPAGEVPVPARPVAGRVLAELVPHLRPEEVVGEGRHPVRPALLVDDPQELGLGRGDPLGIVGREARHDDPARLLVPLPREREGGGRQEGGERPTCRFRRKGPHD